MMCECYLSCCFQRFPSTSQINLQPFTNKTEALGWDDLACMESVPIEHPKQATFELIGKLLSGNLQILLKLKSYLLISFCLLCHNTPMLNGFCIKVLGMSEVLCLFSNLGLLN
jgi:hypothetical protein